LPKEQNRLLCSCYSTPTSFNLGAGRMAETGYGVLLALSPTSRPFNGIKSGFFNFTITIM